MRKEWKKSTANLKWSCWISISREKAAAMPDAKTSAAKSVPRQSGSACRRKNWSIMPFKKKSFRIAAAKKRWSCPINSPIQKIIPTKANPSPDADSDTRTETIPRKRMTSWPLRKNLQKLQHPSRFGKKSRVMFPMQFRQCKLVLKLLLHQQEPEKWSALLKWEQNS